MLLQGKVRDRRQALKRHFDVAKQFEEIEESCIPSYAHSNPLAAWVSWLRLRQAADLHRAWAPQGDVLDFGSATGELAHFLDIGGDYHFVEENETLVDALQTWLHDATRAYLDRLEPGRFAAVFALDSLEHNESIDRLLDALRNGLREDGVLILSGPTENAIYRLGRSIAGFHGHYHFQTIWDIEARMKTTMRLLGRRVIPMGIPLFSVSAWAKAEH